MEEFEFSSKVLFVAIASAFAAGVTVQMTDSVVARGIGAFGVVALGLITLLLASEEVINWVALQ